MTIKKRTGYDCVIQVLRAANILWRESRRFFRPYGISEAQFNVLHLLGQSPKGMSQRELSDLLVVDRSNVTLLLDRMARHGWTQREDVPGDRRAYRVTLTENGGKLWQRILPHYYDAVKNVTDSIPSRNLKVVLEVLQKIESQSERWRRG